MGLMVGLGWRWGEGWVWWCVLGWRWRDGWVWDGGAKVGGVLGRRVGASNTAAAVDTPMWRVCPAHAPLPHRANSVGERQQLVIGTAAAGNAALSEAIFRHLAGQEGAVSVRVGVPHRLPPRSSLHFRTQCLPLWCCSCKRAWGVLARPRLGPCSPPWQRMRSRHSSCRCQVQGSALCPCTGGGLRVDPP